MPYRPGDFRRIYHSFDRVWSDCYVGYRFIEFNGRAPSKQAVLAWFVEHPAVHVFAVQGSSPIQLKMEDRTVWEVATQEAVQLIETMLDQAVHYGSNEHLPSGTYYRLATSFLSEFDAPLTLTNFRLSVACGRRYIGSLNNVVAGYGYSCEALVCCVDHHHMGFFFSIENE